VNLAKYRKYLVAAFAPAVPVLAYFLGVQPFASADSGLIWYTFILAEAAAFGVYGAKNG
jgi:hypothetical protein